MTCVKCVKSHLFTTSLDGYVKVFSSSSKSSSSSLLSLSHIFSPPHLLEKSSSIHDDNREDDADEEEEEDDTPSFISHHPNSETSPLISIDIPPNLSTIVCLFDDDLCL